MFILRIMFVSIFCLALEAYATPITYGINVSTEADYLDRLFKQICGNLDEEDRILIQIDAPNTNKEVTKVIEKCRSKVLPKQLKVIYSSLNGHFGNFRNNLIKHAEKKGFMFQIDADEYLSFTLMQNLKWFISSNKTADIIKVPRVNYYVASVTDDTKDRELLSRFSQASDSLGREQYPDFQGRIFNLENSQIRYDGKLHEQLIGSDKVINMPHYVNNSNQGFEHIRAMKKIKISEDLYKSLSEVVK